MKFPCIFTTVLLLATLVGCGQPESPPVDPGAEGRHVFTAVDGAEMPYVVSGEGETTLVLVHCWMCDRSFWGAQVPVLRELYRVITLDLPGHGEGSATRESWSIEGYGEDVAGLVKHLGLERVVLVGHSMGGPVALKAAALSAGRVLGVVAVDTLHDAEFDFSKPEMQEIVRQFEEDFVGTCGGMVDQMFVEQGVDEIKAEVKRVGCVEGNEEAGKALMRDFATVDLRALFSEAGVPIRAINAGAPNPTRTQVNRKYADFDAVLVVGVGHYLQLTRPDQFNSTLLQTLDKMLAPPPAPE
jgi:pimeloyl-ACP methyl ester carboxylesterase